MNWRWQRSFHHLPVNVIRFGAVLEYQAKVLFHADLRLCQHSFIILPSRILAQP